jgi:RimJ/RimL family protein N-acetyltransferase
LRPFREDDAEFVLAIFNDESFIQFIGDRNVRTLDQARDYITSRLLQTHHPPGLGPFVAELQETSQAIGFCTLFRRAWLEDVDLGFAFLPEFRSRGFAIEASRAMLDYAHDTMGCTRISAIASSKNVASARLLARLGFVPSGSVRPPGEESDVSLFVVDLE